MTLGERIRARRIQLGMNQMMCAKLLGVSNSYLSSVELGKKTVSIKKLNAIANNLQLEAGDLLEQGNDILASYRLLNETQKNLVRCVVREMLR